KYNWNSYTFDKLFSCIVVVSNLQSLALFGTILSSNQQIIVGLKTFYQTELH
ncbi:21644_t:CDS:1, partial [Racocetra persica]